MKSPLLMRLSLVIIQYFAISIIHLPFFLPAHPRRVGGVVNLATRNPQYLPLSHRL